MASTRDCVMCGKPFEVCLPCASREAKYRGQYGYAPWRTVACSVECYQMYNIVRRYGFGELNIADAHEMLLHITDMPDLELKPAAAQVVKKIQEYSPVAKARTRKKKVAQDAEPEVEPQGE